MNIKSFSNFLKGIFFNFYIHEVSYLTLQNNFRLNEPIETDFEGSDNTSEFLKNNVNYTNSDIEKCKQIYDNYITPQSFGKKITAFLLQHKNEVPVKERSHFLSLLFSVIKK